MITTAAASVGGYPHRISENGTVTRRERGQWRVLTRTELLALPRDGEVWDWLRAHGVKRAPPSGPSGPTQPETERENRQIKLRLTPEAEAELRRRADQSGLTMSAVVSALLTG